MSKYYSSGELAKMCKITTRTVQFYDKEGLLKPSKVSEGGRRQYTESDYIELKCICLYRSLGLSLNEIKQALENGSIESIKVLINEQSSKIDNDIFQLNQRKERLCAILEQINQSGKLCVKSIDELESLTKKKQKYKKTNVMTVLWILSYCLFLMLGSLIVMPMGDFISAIFIALALVLLLALVYWHKKVNAYICPECNNKFSIGFLNDLFSPNGLKGKYLKCPLCNTRSWCNETYPD